MKRYMKMKISKKPAQREKKKAKTKADKGGCKRAGRFFAILTAFIMTVTMMPALCFAEVIGEDPVENQSSDVATIYVGKELKVSQAGQFPYVSDFNYELRAVKGWTSSNENADGNGANIDPANMPKPENEENALNRVDNNGAVTSITVGSFQDDNADTLIQDSGNKKFRYTPVSIRFRKPGYYLYQLTETASVPENVPGLDRDTHSYYVVVYVCSKTDESGNTENAVYVHNITSYRNEEGREPVEPNLSNIQEISDIEGTGVTSVQVNNAENLGKVGISAPEKGSYSETGLESAPDKLDAFRFFADYSTQDLVIRNTVKGNLGDINKKFEYTVTLTGLEPNKAYKASQPAQGITPAVRTNSNAELITLQQSEGGKGAVSNQNKTLTAGDDGNITFKLKLVSGGVLVINALPAYAKYTVVQSPADHVASFKMTSTEESPRIETPSAENTVADKLISTAEETVDKADGTVTISFTNHRDLVTPTGLPYHGDYVYVMAAILMAAVLLLVFSVRRRRREEQ